jgi:hypothetical protein
MFILTLSKIKHMKNVMSDKKTDTRNTDLPDSKEDQEKLKQEVVTIDMPEVQDIPGQENIRVPDMKEMQDVTISSADEEAEELLSEINTGPGGDDDRDNNERFATRREKSLRKAADQPGDEESKNNRNMRLDNSDEDNEELNEKGSGTTRYGEDLDVPGSELDDADEETGEEDEENNQYSRPD